MHIYAFGSICRGDISVDSDVDLLALVEGRDSRLDPEKFSIYSYARMLELWEAGNAFAWHLSLESRLIYAADGTDFLRSLGSPSRYSGAVADCLKFRDVYVWREGNTLAPLQSSTTTEIKHGRPRTLPVHHGT